jgi:hypothetical protein
VKFAPAIRPQLFELMGELDDGERPIAEVWRELGYLARARKLLQPSYESVRRAVHGLRELRRLQYSRLKRAAILSAEFLWNTRDRKGIVLDAWDGRDVERRRERYQRRPRGDRPRPTPREDA